MLPCRRHLRRSKCKILLKATAPPCRPPAGTTRPTMLPKTMYDNLIDHCTCTVAFIFSAFFPSALPPSAGHRASVSDVRVTARLGVSSWCSWASVAPDLARFNTREGNTPLVSPLAGRYYLLCTRCGGWACENKEAAAGDLSEHEEQPAKLRATRMTRTLGAFDGQRAS